MNYIEEKKWRDFFEGKLSLIIHNGIVDQNAMRKQRYSIDDLLYQLRDKDVSTSDEVQFAILENSGVSTVLKKTESCVHWPEPLIADSVVQKAVLTKAWLYEAIKKEGCSSPEEIFFVCIKKMVYLFLKNKICKTQWACNNVVVMEIAKLKEREWTPIMSGKKAMHSRRTRQLIVVSNIARLL